MSFVIYIDDILKLYYSKTFAERQSFIWRFNPSMSEILLVLEDPNGEKIYYLNKEFNIYVLLGRPVFFNDNIYGGEFLFHKYLP